LFVNPVKMPANAQVLGGLPDTLRFLDGLELKQRVG
jgi:hypothetical protein